MDVGRCCCCMCYSALLLYQSTLGSLHSLVGVGVAAGNAICRRRGSKMESKVPNLKLKSNATSTWTFLNKCNFGRAQSRHMHNLIDTPRKLPRQDAQYSNFFPNTQVSPILSSPCKRNSGRTRWCWKRQWLCESQSGLSWKHHANSLILLSIDNSEWMRNGDYLPTRWDAQSDAVNLVFDAKTSSNPESRVGLISMAGKR